MELANGKILLITSHLSFYDTRYPLLKNLFILCLREKELGKINVKSKPLNWDHGSIKSF